MAGPASDESASTPPTSSASQDWHPPTTMLPTLTLTPAKSQDVYEPLGDPYTYSKDDRLDQDEPGEDANFYQGSMRMGSVGLNMSLSNVSLGDTLRDTVPDHEVRFQEEDHHPEDDEPNEDEEAAIAAHLARWSEAEKQRRKSVRQRRTASTIATAPNGQAPTGLLRRLSTLRRPASSAAAPSTPGARVRSSTALAPVPSSPQEPQPPESPSQLSAPASPRTDRESDHFSSGLGLTLTDHQEVHMTGYTFRPFKGKRKDDSAARPRPTNQKPLVTAGPAPVRSMSLRPPPRESHRPRGRARASRSQEHPLSSDSLSPSSASPSPSPHRSRTPANGERRPEELPRERGFWLTDFLCCFGTPSNDDDTQAGRTNPLE